MKIFNLLNYKQYENKNISGSIPKISLIAFLCMFLFEYTAMAQNSAVTHPAPEVTNSAKFYKYRFNMSADSYKDIGYVLVRSSDNEVKCAFNACDVCYPANKGYSQSKTNLRCNNCGKSFEIDKLGSQTPGGCWPSHLNSRVEGNDVYIEVADLLKGEYLFPKQTVSDVIADEQYSLSVIISGNSSLSFKTNAENISSVSVFSLNGMLSIQTASVSQIMNIDISQLSTGTYVLVIDVADKPLTYLFNIVR